MGDIRRAKLYLFLSTLKVQHLVSNQIACRQRSAFTRVGVQNKQTHKVTGIILHKIFAACQLENDKQNIFRGPLLLTEGILGQICECGSHYV